MRKDVLVAVVALTFAAHSALVTAQANAPVLFVADSQVHNVYGVPIKQMFPFSDLVSKVAIRPPELNLLAPLTLRHAISTGQARLPADNRTVVVLGDGTNISCSGEMDLFDAEFTRSSARPGTVRLMAHGNHDSYMMGTLNSFVPDGPNARRPDGMMSEALPVDEAWWNPTDVPVETSTSGANRSWLDACYKPATSFPAGTPMNKVRWLARYSASLAPHGLVQSTDGTTTSRGFKFVGSGRPGSKLAAMNYHSRGVWYRPWVRNRRGDLNYLAPWKSFMVQAADVSDRHTLVLIDTSVCESANVPTFPFTNAGQHACIGSEQFGVIRRVLREIPAERSVVFAGHFPLKELKHGERNRLIAIMRERSPLGWSYVSGHTHDKLSNTGFAGGADLNIGSTTDWPMESHVLHFDPAGAKIVAIQTTRLEDQIKPLGYSLTDDMAGNYSELCRHLGPARALAQAKPAQYGSDWASPKTTAAECKAIQSTWLENARQLAAYQDQISERFDKESDYHEFALRVAAGASLFEQGQWVTGWRIP